MQIDKRDNIRVELSSGHKIALYPISKGETVIKYGQPIGHATKNIEAGEAVHSHNLATNLSGVLEYCYSPINCGVGKSAEKVTFMGYRRENGSVGIRNDIWIINTVGCVNKTAQILAERTGSKYFAHPYGCSQLGRDHDTTQKILAALVKHPNAGGVLVLGLGCENNNIEAFKKVLGSWDAKRVRFLNAQDYEDEISEGIRIINELKNIAATDVKEPIGAEELIVGLKCGGSDGLSGITANPMVGRFSDRLISHGGSTVLTEVPEMFGAEHLLMQRCKNREVFQKTVDMINNFKKYFSQYGHPIYENPSPGNRAGGITTLEEKSLGCIQKGGTSPVVDVLDMGQSVKERGLSLLNGPGNDMVAVTNLVASGAHLILFTTGRGTPLGGPVPTIKIASNSDLAQRKPRWIDFDAQSGNDKELFDLVIEVASGAAAKNELNKYEEIAIFKNGVTL